MLISTMLAIREGYHLENYNYVLYWLCFNVKMISIGIEQKTQHNTNYELFFNWTFIFVFLFCVFIYHRIESLNESEKKQKKTTKFLLNFKVNVY